MPFSALLAAVALGPGRRRAGRGRLSPSCSIRSSTPRSGPPTTQVQPPRDVRVRLRRRSATGPDYVRVRIGDTTVRMRSDPASTTGGTASATTGTCTLAAGHVRGHVRGPEPSSRRRDARRRVDHDRAPTDPHAQGGADPDPDARRPSPSPSPSPSRSRPPQPTARARATPRPTPKPTPKAGPRRQPSAPRPRRRGRRCPSPRHGPWTRRRTARRHRDLPSTPAVVAVLVPGRRSGGPGRRRIDDRRRDGGRRSGRRPVAPWGPLTSADRGRPRHRPAATCPPCRSSRPSSRRPASRPRRWRWASSAARRREDDEPDPGPLLAADAAKGVGLGGRRSADRRRRRRWTGRRGRRGRATARRRRPDPPTTTRPPCRAGADRRCSRRARPTRCAPSRAAPRLFFDEGFSGTLAGHERRLVRYTVVRLLDAPDELRGRRDRRPRRGRRGGAPGTPGRLLAGGLPGRRPRLDPQDDARRRSSAAATVADAPTATLPIAAESWTMGDDVDDDVLAAYLASRQPQRLTARRLPAQHDDVLVRDVRDERARIAVRSEPRPGLVPDRGRPWARGRPPTRARRGRRR